MYIISLRNKAQEVCLLKILPLCQQNYIKIGSHTAAVYCLLHNMWQKNSLQGHLICGHRPQHLYRSCYISVNPHSIQQNTETLAVTGHFSQFPTHNSQALLVKICCCVLFSMPIQKQNWTHICTNFFVFGHTINTTVFMIQYIFLISKSQKNIMKYK